MSSFHSLLVSPRELTEQASIHVNCLSINELRLVRSKESNCSGHIFNLSHPSNRRNRGPDFSIVRVFFASPCDFYGTRRNTIDGDPIGSQFNSSTAGQNLQPSFATTILHEVGKGALVAPRPNVHDTAPAMGDHLLGGPLNAKKGAL